MADLPGDLDDWPEELRVPEALERVVAWLRVMPLPIQSKRKRLTHWAQSLGIVLDKSYFARLE